MNIGGCFAEGGGGCPRRLSAQSSSCQGLAKTAIPRSIGQSCGCSQSRMLKNRWSPSYQTYSAMVGKAMAEDKAVDSKVPSKKGRKASAGKSGMEERMSHYTRAEGILVRTVKSKIDSKTSEMAELEIQVEGVEDDCIVPKIVWGVYRASPDAWQHPESICPPESAMDEGMNAMSSPMEKSKDGSKYAVTFSIPCKSGPLNFAFIVVLENGDSKEIVTPFASKFFVSQIGYQGGSATPLGPSMHTYESMGTRQSKKTRKKAEEKLVNFAVHCQGNASVNLVIISGLDSEGVGTSGIQKLEIALDPVHNRTGSIWHACLPCSSEVVGFGWRVDGDLSWDRGSRISPDKVLIDPEAPMLLHVDPDEALAGFPTIEDVEGNTKCIVSALSLQGDAGNIAVSGKRPSPSSILTIDVDEFGFDLDFVENPGTYLGLAEAAEYIKDLNVDAVSLVSCHACVIGHAKRAVSLFAPDPNLDSTGSGVHAVSEFKYMVESLHRHGIQVIMVIDPTFTSDGTDEDPATKSWRGLDFSGYYRPNGVLNCGKPVTEEYLIRALRHWALEYGVDGFEFLNAENMTQDADGFVLDAPSLPDSLCHDPILSGTKLIAAPSNYNLLPREGARGFPHWGKWMEKNGDKLGLLQLYLTPETSLNLSHVQAAASCLAGRPRLFNATHEGFPGNLAIERPISYFLNDVDGSAWVEDEQGNSVISTAAGAARAVISASGNSDFLPTNDHVTAAILASVIFSSGIPSIPQIALDSGSEMVAFISQILEYRRSISEILDSGSIGTWHNAGGGHPDWNSGELDSPFLGRQITGGSGNVFLALNPGCQPVHFQLPVNGAWYGVVDSSCFRVSKGKSPLHQASILAPKSFALFIAE